MLLQGLRVLDLTRLLPGPFCSLLLADMGADVVKVEDPDGGDYLRHTAPPQWFAGLNRGKRSLALDLSSSAGREVLLRLAAGADAVLEGFRPGVLDRWGIGWEQLRAVNPGLVLVSISGYGQTGPLAERAGHDLNYLARAGMLELARTPGEGPRPQAVQYGDLVAGGILPAMGTLAAVLSARATGEGCHVDAAMFDGLLFLQFVQVADRMARQRPPRPGEQALLGDLACYQTYTTAEGDYISLAALEPKFFKSFCLAVGRPDLVPLHLDLAAQPRLRAELAAIFAGRRRGQWEQLSADCCLEPVLELGEALAQPQTQARHLLRGLAPAAPFALRWAGDWQRPPAGEPTAPALGQHSRELLAGAGYTEDEIAALVGAGTVGR